jgi:hypothetical protein
MAKDPVLDQEMLWLSDSDCLRFRDLVEGGTLITGGLGAGKSSTSAKNLAMSFLRSGLGGLVLTVKSSDASNWLEYARKTGRERDVIVFNPESGLRFDPLAYCWNQPGRAGGFLESVIELFTLLMAVGKAYTPSSGEKYFEQAVEELLRATIVLLAAARRPISIFTIHQIISSLPQLPDQYKDKDFVKTSEAGKLINKLKTDPHNFTETQQGDLDVAMAYLYEKWPALDERTRSNIESTWSGMASKFAYSPFREMFSSGTYDFTPEQTTHAHKLVICDFPSLEFGRETARIVQILVKIIFERAWMRHQYKPGCCHGAFEFQDEFEMLLHRNAAHWHSVCRSNAVAPVCITPNILGLASEEFGEQQPGSKTLGFLGLLSVKIFHANNETQTNQYAADQIGKHWQDIAGWSATSGDHHNSHAGVSGSKQLVHILEPLEFTRLMKPDGENPNAEAVCYMSGRIFNATKTERNPQGRNYLRVLFSRE